MNLDKLFREMKFKILDDPKEQKEYSNRRVISFTAPWPLDVAKKLGKDRVAVSICLTGEETTVKDLYAKLKQGRASLKNHYWLEMEKLEGKN